MESLFEVFKQDLQAAENALDEEDFRSLNILSNRIMSNASILNAERKFAITGFMLKEISMLLAQIKGNVKVSPYSTALSLAKEHVKKLVKQTSMPSFSEDELWKAYSTFLDNIRTYEMPDFESGTYTKNHEFTKVIFANLLTYLDDNKNKLTNPRNQLLAGILNEMTRVHRTHGGELSEVYTASVMYLLVWCEQFPKAAANSREDYEEMMKRNILPLVEKAASVLRQSSSSEEVYQLIWELIKVWRNFFIDFMDPAGTFAVEAPAPRPILLPEETKKKLTTAITKSIEEEINTKAK